MASNTVSDSERICITYLFPLTVHPCASAASVRLACRVCASSLACPAHRSYRALWASRVSRHAYQGAQLHDGLIELPGALAVAGHQSAGEIPDATWRDGAWSVWALPDGALPGEALPVVRTHSRV